MTSSNLLKRKNDNSFKAPNSGIRHHKAYSYGCEMNMLRGSVGKHRGPYLLKNEWENLDKRNRKLIEIEFLLAHRLQLRAIGAQLKMGFKRYQNLILTALLKLNSTIWSWILLLNHSHTVESEAHCLILTSPIYLRLNPKLNPTLTNSKSPLRTAYLCSRTYVLRAVLSCGEPGEQCGVQHGAWHANGLVSAHRSLKFEETGAASHLIPFFAF